MDPIEKLTAELEAEKAAHATTKAELEAEKDAHEATKKDSTAIITDLKGKVIEESKKAKSDVVIVKHDKESYEVTTPTFRYNGEVYKASDLLKNKALVAELIEKDLGVLVPVK